ncbi:fluoride efflux transporter CrcB [Flavobacterium sp. MFBS3-15]|uniref:fluoride efflux transporter CrcB n=1 Tax=Flavobacterium sp. MFBS3-15 TaxID=2989816 RepID=UPI00223573FD|nr:fluoride efflux transporter CrcB [Flavobacterium sp. MFBS3-15]MCW4467736.1 fluoride efflux transporter CrcB [Flavobacterium sp. MFBS3-15]
MIKSILLVGLGGAIGSILRYLSAMLVNKYWHSTFPLATFLINMLGCLLIGVFMAIIEKQPGISDNFRLLFVTGFCGGFTTYSAFAYENTTLMTSGQTLIAFAYIAASVLAGLLFVWLGIMLGRWF